MKSFKLARTIGGAIAVSAMFVTAVFAQQMGQMTTGVMPQQRLIRGPEFTPSPLDQARLERMRETPYQRAMRTFRPASAIEKLYRQRLGMEIENIPPQQPGTAPSANMALLDNKRPAIDQFGYDIFAGINFPLENVSGSVTDSYILGIGDEIVVYLKGAQDANFITQIDREGRFITPLLDPIKAAGLSFGDFKALLEAEVKESLLGVEVTASIGSLRNITAYVFGEVHNPGAYLMTSLSTPLELLAVAEGVFEARFRQEGAVLVLGALRGDDHAVALFFHRALYPGQELLAIEGDFRE